MLLTNSAILKFAVALGIGLLIGAERERRKGTGPSRGPAGIRTFAITALLGALSLSLGGVVLLGICCAGVISLLALAYARSHELDPGVTTEVALVTTLLLGAWATREPALASAVAVVVAILLSSREQMHSFVRKVLTAAELRDALMLAAATLVVLPLVPNRYMGPYDALNPRTIWLVMILCMTIQAAGHIAVRSLGSRFGLPLTGLASGFISSAVTIGSMGSQATKQPALMRPAVAGAVLSTLATPIQMTAVLAAISKETLAGLAIPLVSAGLTAAGYGALFTIRAIARKPHSEPKPSRAFNLKDAVILATFLSALLVLSAALKARLGESGVTILAGVAGFVDTHAAAASVASLVASGKLAAGDATLPILVAVTANTVTKIGFALTAGSRMFAMQVIPGLLLVAMAIWIGKAVA